MKNLWIEGTEAEEPKSAKRWRSKQILLENYATNLNKNTTFQGKTTKNLKAIQRIKTKEIILPTTISTYQTRQHNNINANTHKI